MALRHHYSVSASDPQPDERRYHLFAEADSRFGELSEESVSAGRRLVSESYWRRRYAAEGGPNQDLAIDDCGLVDCDGRCGGD